MEELYNNFYMHGHSEKTQDAFLSWMLSLGMNKAKCNTNIQDWEFLHEFAIGFLQLAIPEIKLCKQIEVVKLPEQQYKNIDILVTIKADDKDYKLIIEDKTETIEHSNQLKKYMDKIKKIYPKYIVKGLYYQTGYQADYSGVIKENYNIITRSKMLEFMSKYDKKINNIIWKNYYEYYSKIEKESQDYKNIEINEWNKRQFFCFLENLLLHNKKGIEFFNKYNYIIDNKYFEIKHNTYLYLSCAERQINIDGVKVSIYMQIEFNKKINPTIRAKIENSTDYNQILEKIINYISNKGLKGYTEFRKRVGKTMRIYEWTNKIDNQNAIDEVLKSIESYINFIQSIND